VRDGAPGFSYLEIGDRGKAYRAVRGRSLSYKVDAGRVVDAEFLDLDALLPPHLEDALVAMRADQVLEEAYDDYFGELIDQDDEDD
jgi:hypothetical protein